MTLLRTLKKLILGETWVLPLGVTVILLAAVLVIRPLMAGAWHSAGGFLLLAGVAAVLLISVWLSGGRRR